MKTYKCNWQTVEETENGSYIIDGEREITPSEFHELVAPNLGERPKYKRALTIIYEEIFEGVKSSIVTIINN